jgi:glycerophosphoryl diester phosphodiesterase
VTLVVAHRGACGYRPEHTLAAYELAARRGAAHIEPDLVITRDGVLVARHEPEISATTDVAECEEFAERRTTKQVDGVATTGWFVEDFTLAELRTLRARERIPLLRPLSAAYDGQFGVPTLQEVLDLRERLSRELGSVIGVYTETKHPAYFRRHGLALEQRLADVLRANGLDGAGAPVILQSFDPASLRELRGRLDLPLVQLLDGDRESAAMATPTGMRAIAGYARGVGPPKRSIVPRDEAGRSLEPTTLVDDAHAAGLFVHAYTFRAENAFLPLELRSSPDPAEHGDLAAEVRQFVELGVDGVFTDNPDKTLA